MNCRACGHALQYVHGHGACYFTGCLLWGQNQAPCCDGEIAVRTPPSSRSFTKADLAVVLEAPPNTVFDFNEATKAVIVTFPDTRSGRRAAELLQERRSSIPPTWGVELRWPAGELER